MTIQELKRFKGYILDPLAPENEKTFIVGGACRSIFDGGSVKDIDICTTNPERFIENLSNYCLDKQIQYKISTMSRATIFSMHFESLFGNMVQIEISKYVENEEFDGGERDFTCNALHWPCVPGMDNSEPEKVIMFPVTGDNIYLPGDKVLVPVYNNSMFDNPVRIFRAADLISRHYGYTPSHECYTQARRIMTPMVSPGSGVREACIQILDKIIKDWSEGNRDWVDIKTAFNFLAEVGGWKLVCPAIQQMVELRHNGQYHKDTVWQHTMSVLDNIEKIWGKFPSKYGSPKINECLLWAALLHDTGKVVTVTTDSDGIKHFYGHQDASVDIAKDILIKASLSTQQRSIILNLIKYHMVTKPYHNDRIPEKKYWVIRNLMYQMGSRDAMNLWIDLNNADCRASTRPDPEQINVVDVILKIDGRIGSMEPNWYEYKAPITGAEIKQELDCDDIFIKYYLDQIINYAMHHPENANTKEKCINYIHTLGREWKERMLKDMKK